MERTGGKASLSTAMTLLWERFGRDRIGLRADDYWAVLEEVAGESLNDLRANHAEGSEDTWDALVQAMSTQGLMLSKSLDAEGIVRVRIEPNA